MPRQAAEPEVAPTAPKQRGRPKGSTKKVTSERDKITRTRAIRLQCIECMGFQVGLVNSCNNEGCPLWPFRTGRGQQHTSAKMLPGFYEKKLVKPEPTEVKPPNGRNR